MLTGLWRLFLSCSSFPEKQAIAADACSAISTRKDAANLTKATGCVWRNGPTFPLKECACARQPRGRNLQRASTASFLIAVMGCRSAVAGAVAVVGAETQRAAATGALPEVLVVAAMACHPGLAALFRRAAEAAQLMGVVVVAAFAAGAAQLMTH